MTVGTIFNIFAYLPMLELKKQFALWAVSKNTSRKALLLPILVIELFR
jgi:hypothetical protein